VDWSRFVGAAALWGLLTKEGTETLVGALSRACPSKSQRRTTSVAVPATGISLKFMTRGDTCLGEWRGDMFRDDVADDGRDDGRDDDRDGRGDMFGMRGEAAGKLIFASHGFWPMAALSVISCMASRGVRPLGMFESLEVASALSMS
jgi:hypothetical protein